MRRQLSKIAGRRKAFGQHFLQSPAIIQTIVEKTNELVKAFDCQQLVEIGPGKGAITFELVDTLDSKVKFRAVEKDHLIVEFWNEQDQKIDLIHQDFLEVNLKDDLFIERTGIVSNLPYSAGTAILNRLVEYPLQVPFMVLMFQAEVAKKVRAEIGSKDTGSLSIWIQNRWEVKKLVTVPPGAFQPPPKVQSEVITLLPRKEPMIADDAAGLKALDQLLRKCFKHRRKMLRAVLKSEQEKNALMQSGIDPTKRAHALNWTEWKNLFLEFTRATSRSS